MATLAFLLLTLPLSAAIPRDMGALHRFIHDGLAPPAYSLQPVPQYDTAPAGHGIKPPPGQPAHSLGGGGGGGGWAVPAWPHGDMAAMDGASLFRGYLGAGSAASERPGAAASGFAGQAGGPAPSLSGTFSMGKNSPRPGGSSQLHLMEKLGGGPSKPSQASPAEKFSPVGVAADYTYFASKLAGGGVGGGAVDNGAGGHRDPYAATVPITDVGHMLLEAHGGAGTQPATDLLYHGATGTGPATDLHNHGASGTGPATDLHRPLSNLQANPAQQPSLLNPSLHPARPPQHSIAPPSPHQSAMIAPPSPQRSIIAPPTPKQAIAPPLPALIPPTAEQLLMSNLFVLGLDKAGEQKQQVPDPLSASSRTPGGLGPIKGLTAPLYDVPRPSTLTTAGLRAPCDLYVDALFALDDTRKLWLARDTIRYYETQLLPSRKTRFGVVLCGQHKTFYTALHGHFSTLLASLEDLQHANATLEPTQHMPDTPGYRSENNPYPPRVSEDFAQIDRGCLETAYNLLTYQRPPASGGPAQRLLTVVGTKERWASQVAVEEARYLHSRNISVLTLADNTLSTRAKDSLRLMASSPDKFRAISDTVTLHALPAMIGSAICRPHKADVTVTVQRTSLGHIQQPVGDCRLVDAHTMLKTMDFGPFGVHSEHVRCVAGQVPNSGSCTCV